ncbi:hypothetical protein PN419_00125 [Halorubrum ezzemoulense]|uniref:hypothetical protein n=1 Tax=Halorubrum ezzemoulense TaxID=337243 RepID=UPI00232AF9B7|nr:hypothetical protein [Halorubrum ezzemoulense]MDB9247413.1 hypothetical protein [Halorubrum ezzemoulense]MDB9258678.1 hypothetical protein [Halorubrum ezzemoulense]MDB9264464.1 hypothetical protein [Halorubrum ezzemoulense]MDB9269039.1 hypothetical protein [Halorubrum ezzemoulense]MDB9271432.1 hypothetical protein [Halorubrum ezzemoulense]
MILAARDDFEYPHIDWVSKYSSTVYASAGPPDTDHDPAVDHRVSWRPCDEALEEYIELLESLEAGDGIVVCGHGPAPLMGPVDEVGDGHVITESIDSPARKIRWDQTPSIEFARMDRSHMYYDDVYHVERVEIQRRGEGGDDA